MTMLIPETDADWDVVCAQPARNPAVIATVGSVGDTHKICRRCNQLKPLADFHKDSRTADGRENICKEHRRK